MASLKRPILGTLGFVALWIVLFGVFKNVLYWDTSAKVLNIMGASGLLALALVWETKAPSQSRVMRAAAHSFAFVAVWLFSVYFCDLMTVIVYVNQLLEWPDIRAQLARVGLAGLFFLGLGWVIWGVEKFSQRFEQERVDQAASEQAAKIEQGDLEFLFNPAAPRGELLPDHRVWHPLDPAAWYYGRKSPRLRQSLAALSTYSLAFMLTCMMISLLQGCSEIYEMPAGGGEQKAVAQVLKVQKVIKKKFVINPYSSIVWNPPPIDEVKLQLLEITEHAYQVGYGQGQGAGFAGGTSKGKVRFIRLEYAGGDWNQDFGVGADLNMLIEYGVRTGHKVNDTTESRTVLQLANFPLGKSPPVVYMTGQRNISLSKKEIEVLREYLTTKHGMLFGDNGGSAHFHNQFVSMMRQILPQVEPVRIPLDDVIHRVPFQIPFLPYVAPHGGKDALGWKVDGRWVCYYHPGDIGDAWTDDHSGVSPEIYEACYQLGTNIIFYGHIEYNRWLDAQKK